MPKARDRIRESIGRGARLALVVVVLIPCFALLSRVYVRRMRQLSRDVRDSDSRVQSILQETVQNRMLVKTLESEEMMVERLDDQHRMLQSNVERRTKFRLFSNFFSFRNLIHSSEVQATQGTLNIAPVLFLMRFGL